MQSRTSIIGAENGRKVRFNMDMNSVQLSGWVSRAGIKDGQYPWGWVKLDMPGLQPPATQPIPPHSLFLGFNVKTDKDKSQVDRLKQGGWITAWDCTLTSRPLPDQPEKERRGLQGYSNKLFVSPTRGKEENLVVLAGRVEDTFGNEWIRLGFSYRNPKAPEGTDPWKKRFIKVYVPGGHQVQTGKMVYIRGVVSSKTPSGEDDVIVISKILNAIF